MKTNFTTCRLELFLPWTSSFKTILRKWEESCISEVEQGLNQSQLEITSHTAALLLQISPEHWENLKTADERMGWESMPRSVNHLNPHHSPPPASYNLTYHFKNTFDRCKFCGNINLDSVKHLGTQSNSTLVNTSVNHRSRSKVCKRGLSVRSLQYSYLYFMFHSIQLDLKQVFIRKQSHRHNKHTLPGGERIFFKTILKSIDSSQRLFGVCLKSITSNGVDKRSLACQIGQKIEILECSESGYYLCFSVCMAREKE